MPELTEDRASDRIWPPLWRRGHRMESAQDLLVLDCEYELIADCLKHHPDEARHKTHLSSDDMRMLTDKYGSHWLVGFYIDKGWEVKQGICEECLEAMKSPDNGPARII